MSLFENTNGRSGYESIDILLDVEKSFGISLTDNEAKNIITVGDLCNIVQKKIPLPAAKTCFRRNLFYKLRRELMELYHINRVFLHGHTPLQRLCGKWIRSDHRVFWKKNYPEFFAALQRLKWVGWGLWMLRLMTIVACALLWAFNFSFYWLIVNVAIFIASILFQLSGYLRFVVPDDYFVSDLINEKLEECFLGMMQVHNGYSIKELNFVIRRIILRNLPVSEERVVSSARFIEDLHLNE